MNLLIIAHTTAIISFILFITRYYKRHDFNKMKYFIIFLFLVSFVDVIGGFLSRQKYDVSVIYNVLSLLEFNLLFLFYKKISQDKLTKKSINLSMILFNICYLIITIYLGKTVFFDDFNYIGSSIGAFLLSIILLLYLREFLLSDKILNYTKNIFFWITVGLLFYYLGTLPLTATFNFLRADKVKSIFNVYNIQVIITIIMHSCFIFGVLCSWKKAI